MISLFFSYANATEHQHHDDLDYQAPVVAPGSNRNHLKSNPTQTSLTAAASAGCGNPVTCENLLPGSPPSEWSIKEPGDSTIRGFATDTSINAGGTIRFKIKTTASAYHIDIYRAGWYQGKGARKVTPTLRPSASLPQTQPACRIDTSNTTGLIDCGNWAESAAWSVPSTAVSGVYFARLVRDDTGGSSYIFFNVRNDSRHSAIVYQTSDTTRLAYNPYGGNSLYQCQIACPPANPKPYRGAYKVSFNRPNIAVNLGMQYSFFSAEFQLVEFLEANGYDVSYLSGVDTDRDGARLKNHSVFISSGQDEYWSGNQ
ncbi:MAG: N,N-dimethylformamidase beta subunit family domain-containing protein, partial [Betaproteobacteria bacterium]